MLEVAEATEVEQDKNNHESQHHSYGWVCYDVWPSYPLSYILPVVM